MVEQTNTVLQGQFRSLGGYLDYSEWPERDRFLELDRALQRQALEKENIDDSACSDDQSTPSAPFNGEEPERWRRFYLTPNKANTEGRNCGLDSHFSNGALLRRL